MEAGEKIPEKGKIESVTREDIITEPMSDDDVVRECVLTLLLTKLIDKPVTPVTKKATLVEHDNTPLHGSMPSDVLRDIRTKAKEKTRMIIDQILAERGEE